MTERVSLKATLAGLAIGTLVLCANFQFGLQTGWVSMMSMPAALLGFAWFKTLRTALSPQENVYVQSVAVAVGTGPLSLGFVGAIPAIQLLISDDEGRAVLSVLEMIVWSFGIAFIGIFTAVLLKDIIIRNKQLRFPSGSAAAALIGVLHDKPIARPDSDETDTSLALGAPDDHRDSTYRKNIFALVAMFLVSAIYTALSKCVWFLNEIPIFGCMAAEYMWTFNFSPAYIGQGIIMGLPTTAAMLLGAVVGWAILVPLSEAKGWATGPLDDWKTGAQGWIMWVSLAVMVADTGVSFVLLLYSAASDTARKAHRTYRHMRPLPTAVEPELAPQQQPEMAESHVRSASRSSWGEHITAGLEHVAVPSSIEHPSDQRKFGMWGLVLSSLLCIACVKLLFGSVPILALSVAVLISPLLSLLGVRALGETDLNPVSSIAKLTQFVFGLMMRNKPQAVLLNIVAGAITEAGAQQAGDLMQDYKTGDLLGAPMTQQTIGMTVGTLWSVVLSACIYKLYTTHFEIPGKEFRIPTAYIWADCAELMTGDGLPPRAGLFAGVFGVLFIVLAIVKRVLHNRPWSVWIPSGVAVGIGMYNVPNFTLARFVGGVAVYFYSWWYPNPADEVYMVILSSGLILGEGLMSVLYLFIKI